MLKYIFFTWFVEFSIDLHTVLVPYTKYVYKIFHDHKNMGMKYGNFLVVMSTPSKLQIPTIPRDCGTVISLLICRETLKIRASGSHFHSFKKDFKYGHTLPMIWEAL